MITLEKYKISKISFDDYLNILLDSKDYNGFSDPYFLSIIFEDISFYSVDYSSQILAVFPIIENFSIRDLFLIKYYGLSWSRFYNSQKKHKKIYHHQRAIFLINEFFIGKKMNLEFSNFYTGIDVRPYVQYFSLLNQSELIKIVPKYTAVIAGLNQLSETELLMSYRQAKRYEILKFKDELSMKEEIIDFDVFRNLYIETIELGNHEIDDYNQPLLALYQAVIKYENLKILVHYYENDIIGYILLLLDKRQTNCLMKTTKKDFIRYSPVLFHNAIIYTKSIGINIFDFNGANSLIGA